MNEMTSAQFCAALRYLNMTQGNCAAFLCISYTYVSEYALGKRKIPDHVAKMLTDLVDSPEGARADFQRRRRTKQQIAADNIERIRKMERR